MNWNILFAKRTKFIKRSPIREILKITERPEIISFAGGLPAPEVFPLERMKDAYETVLKKYGSSAFQYSPTEGILPLRTFLAERYSNENVTIDPDNILIVTGSQQSLDLIARLFLDEEDTIIIENPTYLGMLLACNIYNPTYLTVDTDEKGMQTDKLASLMKQKAKLLYVVPNFQNPQGTTLSLDRRNELITIAAKHALPIIEDNPYGELRYSGEHISSLMELDAQISKKKELDGNVISLGTFSKTLAPGLRVGWVIAPKTIIKKLVEIKQATDLHSGTLDQFLAYETAKDGFLDKHIKTIRTVYGERRDMMIAAMKNHFPKQVWWTQPEGGLFLMVHMPPSLDATDLLREALEFKVAFVPGADFHVGGVGHNTFRLNFSNANPRMIEEGISRLGLLLKKAIITDRKEKK